MVMMVAYDITLQRNVSKLHCTPQRSCYHGHQYGHMFGFTGIPSAVLLRSHHVVSTLNN